MRSKSIEDRQTDRQTNKLRLPSRANCFNIRQGDKADNITTLLEAAVVSVKADWELRSATELFYFMQTVLYSEYMYV